MKFWGLVGIFLLGVVAFLLGQRLSADAVGMALGVLFGVLASIPAALLVIASGRRRSADYGDDDEDYDDGSYDNGGYDNGGYGERRGRRQAAYNALPSQAPVIIFAPPTAQLPPGYDGMVQTAANHDHHSGRGVAQPPRALPGPTPRTVDGGRSFKVIGEREEWITEW